MSNIDTQNKVGNRNAPRGAQRSKNQKYGQPQKQDSQRKQRNESNTVLKKTQARRGEVFQATRRLSENVNLQASQHIIDVPVNKSLYNGYGGRQFNLNMQKTMPRRNGDTLRVIPVGGVGEMGIGKNMTAFEYGDDIIVIDTGLLFPGNDYPGVNYIVPDINYLEERKHKIRGVVYTHGHLDHIGAARHILPKIPAPVYGTKFTLAMVEKNMNESSSPYRPIYNAMDPFKHERVQLGDAFSIELVHVCHSIPGGVAVVVRTPVGTVFVSGDWRFEEEPVDGLKIDMTRIKEIADSEGFVLMLNESTNAEEAGTHTHSEFDVKRNIGAIMDRNTNSRLIVSAFSSQLHRIQVILEQAAAHGRKVAVAGFSLVQNLEVALRTGAINVPKNTIVRMEELVKLPDGKAVVICTGSQGEFNAVLNRMASGAHKHLKIKPTDLIVFSSNPIPGNEKYVVRTVDNLMREGSDVIENRKVHLRKVEKIHLSGHAYYDDHIEMINAVKPRYYMPYHGEFHMLVHNAEIAEFECGVPRDRIFVCDAGDVIELDHHGFARKTGRVEVGGIMFDDFGQEVSEVVLKDRLHMANEGMLVVVLTVHQQTGRLLTSPDIVSRGFIYLRDSEEIMNSIRSYLKQKVGATFSGSKYNLDNVKKEIKDDLTHILYDMTHRTPIVIPVINEIGGRQNKQQNSGGQSRQGDSGRPEVKPVAKEF